MKILVINRGSNNLKCSLYEFDTPPQVSIPPLWKAQLEWRGNYADRTLRVKNYRGEMHSETVPEHTIELAIDHLLNNYLCGGNTGVLTSLDEIDVIGHRVVHGGKYYSDSVLIDDKVKETLRSISWLAPLHNLQTIECIEIIEKLIKNKPQVAVFDTAFHQSLSEEVTTYPGPYQWYEDDVRRYGFHGISYKYVYQRSSAILKQDLTASKIIICHLGSGASLCAIKEGKSIDTTMGLTPMDGLMMDTRSGSIDPGIIIYLLEQKKHSIADVYNILNQESGIWGVTEMCKNMRDVIEKSEKGDQRAALALKIYLHRLNGFIGTMIASLKGLDLLIFTGGVGENAFMIRKKVCENFSFLGIKLNEIINEKVAREDRVISSADSKIKVLMIYTQEAFEIAIECWEKIAKEVVRKGNHHV